MNSPAVNFAACVLESAGGMGEAVGAVFRVKLDDEAGSTTGTPIRPIQLTAVIDTRRPILVSKRLMIGVGAPALVLFALLGVALAVYISMGSEGGSGSWQDYRHASSLLAASERIIVATYLDETTHEIPTVTDENGVVVDSVTEQFLRFRVVEPLKGDVTASEIVYVVNTLGYKSAQIGGGSKSYSYDTIDLTAKEDYILFLESRSLIEGYPTQYGDTLWTRPGEPAIAQLDDAGRLTFIATARYKDTVDDEGLERASGSEAPFEMTKEDIARSVAEK